MRAASSSPGWGAIRPCASMRCGAAASSRARRRSTGKIIEEFRNGPILGYRRGDHRRAGRPADGPDPLEKERRDRFLARIRTALRQPDAFTDAIFDNWLRSIGAESVSDLMTRFRGVISTGTLSIRYSDPTASPPTPRELPITAAVLLRDQPISLAEILSQSKMVGEHLREAGWNARVKRTRARGRPS